MRGKKAKREIPPAEKIDIQSYKSQVKDRPYLEDLKKVNVIQRDSMLSAGVDPAQKNRSGSYIQVDHSVIHLKSLYPGLEVMRGADALRKYEWLDNLFWKLIPAETDEFTKEAQRRPHHGYFLRALPGVKAIYPLQAGLFINEDNVIQNVHNMIIAEEGSNLQVIIGCAADSRVKKGLHIGVSEIYVKKGARLTFTMIHNWAEDIAVRPRTSVLVEEGGIFLSNYICLKPVKTLQMYPKTELAGRGSLCRYNSILFAHPGSCLDVGARVILKAENSRAEIISRAISAGGKIIVRGHLRGEAKGIKAHLECRGLMLSEKGLIDAIPELEGAVQGVDMSHEAAVGKIAQDEIEYLMARGLSQSDAQAAIVRGFLDTSIMGLPDVLQKQMDEAIGSCKTL